MNDGPSPTPPFDNVARRSFERLIRKLLNYPNRPAVVLLNAYSYFLSGGQYWRNAESEFFELAAYYQVPMLSLKACCYHLMIKGIKGFDVTNYSVKSPKLEGSAFYRDKIHPDGETGHRVLADLAIYLVMRTIEQLNQGPPGPEVAAAVQQPIPPPMMPGNYESYGEKCVIGMFFVHAVTEDSGFKWIDENKGANGRQKYGYISTEPGSRLSVKVDTTAGIQTSDAANMTVELLYLRSYEHMGKASVACTSGCSCSKKILDGHQSERSSQLHVLTVLVSQSPACVITVTVLNDTRSGDHKVKLAGVVVSEVPGDGGLRTKGAALNHALHVASHGRRL